MLHHFRYNLAIVSEPRLRPPSYLRYIICALGASVSSSHKTDHTALYRASRRALEEAELNDSSLDSIPLARPQAWILIAVYELLQMHSQRWWMSTARAVKLCQMMGLHVIDAVRPARRSYHIARDWTELEEQRRTFWMAFFLDRYAAFGYGSPMIIDEKDVGGLECPFRSSLRSFFTYFS
jgi:Fungal specific transcription factor domain